MGTGGNHYSSDATAAFGAGVDAMLDTNFTRLTDEQVVAMLREVEADKRRFVAVEHRLLVEIEQRRIPEKAEARSTTQYLATILRLSHAEAAARVNAAKLLGPRLVGGEELEPLLAHTAAAQAAGEISVDHAWRIAKILKRLPVHVDAIQAEAVEQQLAEYARTGWPDDLPRIGDRILAFLDPDGVLVQDKDRQRMRELVIGKQRVDGMSAIRGEITPELRALLDPVLAKLARPGMCNPEDAQSPWTTGDSVGDGIDPEVLQGCVKRDLRSAGQRNHDAVLALLRPEMGPAHLGQHRGMPVSTVVTMTVAELETAAGVAVTASGGRVSIEEALKLAQKSIPWLAVLNHTGMPLYLGRGKRMTGKPVTGTAVTGKAVTGTVPRMANPAQRIALIAAERGCTRPGCDAPATMCQVHHVTEWAKGGPTDIDNLTLACDACHARVHDGPGGWKTVKLGEDSKYAGRTGWIAPAHIDPSGVAQVNHRHHEKEALAESAAKIRARTERESRRHREWLARRSCSGGAQNDEPDVGVSAGSATVAAAGPQAGPAAGPQGGPDGGLGAGLEV
ncbi:DUF222 domain-containing protein [Nocardia sp. NPDC088792]|uniref:HNH endonuclease signature motif containing protein n=1 Tax=Nocardia sp. NPDC088792 TaxID=3364332 RepID=UPI00381E5C22